MADSAVWVLAAFLVLTLPIPWLLSAFAAAVFHELWHWMAISVCGKKVSGLRLKSFGAAMEVSELSAMQEIFCAAAGPLGSFLLVLLGRWLPMMGFCAFVQLIYNLLPVYPLDGGRILESILRLCVPKYAKTVLRVVSLLTVLGILIASAFLFFRFRGGVLPLLMGMTLAMRTLPLKIPCKPAILRVQ